MSADASFEQVWAGDERVFRLGIGELLALEEKLDSGCAAVLNRIGTGEWRIADLKEPIRLGLMGGGTDAKRAKALVEENVVPGRLLEAAVLARAILLKALVGDTRETVGKDEAATGAPEANASPPPLSTEEVQS
ncbi:gene transfer agent family protein [Microvirga sp. BSC39]|uniref:gene transfer agent family protein n=1 Tax=Microvirga sp. BSC39 TaxID=1549810 RepID=UPI00068AD7BE|nr:gene transfer agent family protein [Microvirga sp. BSC39]